jgi:hypothetical protein
VVLDPFFGTGTTGAVAKKLGRHFIGIEREDTYIAGGAEAHRARSGRWPAPKRRDRRAEAAAPRVAFGSLVEMGLITPGTDALRRPAALFARMVRADGSLVLGPAHGLDPPGRRAVQGAEACNGWTFWHVRKGPNLVPIDVLRQQVRSEMERTHRSPHRHADLFWIKGTFSTGHPISVLTGCSNRSGANKRMWGYMTCAVLWRHFLLRVLLLRQVRRSQEISTKIFPGQFEAKVKGYRVFFSGSRGGKLRGEAYGRQDEGRWYAKGGKLCVAWNDWTVRQYRSAKWLVRGDQRPR